MSISSTNRKAGPYNGNGATTTFSFGFKVFSASDLLVVRAVVSSGAETTLAITTDYTVSLNSNQDVSPGGTITTTVAPATGQTLTITSAVAETQGVSITNLGGFFPEVINTALDKLTILVQQLRRDSDRSVKVNLSSTDSPDQLVNTILTSSQNAQTAANDAAASATTAQNFVNSIRSPGGTSIAVPNRTTGQRETGAGFISYNIDLNQFEGFVNGQWGSIGGGATGGGQDKVFVQNHTSVSQPWEVGQDALISGVTVTIASPAVFALAGHGFVAGMQVRLKTTGALPTGLAQTAYFVLATGLTANNFQVSATLGGAAINTSGSQSGVHSVGRCMNANTAGPISILDSGSATIPDGCAWVITG